MSSIQRRVEEATAQQAQALRAEQFAERVCRAIKTRREQYEDSRENEAHIAGLRHALVIALGHEHANRLLGEWGEHY